MNAPVTALEQQPIHFGAERGNVRNHLDVVGLDQLVLKTVHAVAAGWNVGTAAFIRSHHARAGHMLRIAIFVQYPCEMDDVRCVCTDNSQPDIRAEKSASDRKDSHETDRATQNTTTLRLITHSSLHRVRICSQRARLDGWFLP